MITKREPGKSDEEAEKVWEQHKCDCIICATSSGICPATVSSMITEIVELRLALHEARQHNSGNIKVNKRSFDLLVKERNDLTELVRSVRQAIASVCPADDNIKERTTLDALNVLILHMKTKPARQHTSFWVETQPTMEQPNAETGLLPCPFCGGAGRFGHTNAGWGIVFDPARWNVHCSTCEAFTTLKSDKNAASEAWNRRASLTLSLA